MKGSDACRILLVGFMASGKSSVGSELARRLGWRFVDVDEVVEHRQGLSIPEIFSQLGEPRFREIEHEVTRALLREQRVVVATGGGWATVPGRLEELPAGTATVWLVVSAEEALRRAGIQSGRRPLLSGPDALAAARRLLRTRAPLYSRAGCEVDTEGFSVEDVSIRVLQFLGLNESATDTQ